MTSLADKYRAHRLAFDLHMELGCTIKEAEAELRCREARERWRAGQDRLAAKINAPIRGNDTSGTLDMRTGAENQPWMMRD